MSTTIWQLQDAKNKFSQVVNNALAHGPQIVTRRGHKAVVIVAYEEFQTLQKPKNSLVDFFKNSPLHGIDLDIVRDQSPPRDIIF